MSYNIIALRDSANIIGYKNDLLYNIPEDMKFFKDLTISAENGKMNAVIMGYNTWTSIPDSYKPLINRINVILTNQHYNVFNTTDIETGWPILIRNNFESTIGELERMENVDQIFIIGGSQIYKQALSFNRIKKIYITEIQDNLFNYLNDKNDIIYFPYFDINDYDIINSETKTIQISPKFNNLETSSSKIKVEIKYRFCTYIPKTIRPISDNIFNKNYNYNYRLINQDEQNYLNLLREIIDQNNLKKGRNGNTYSIFGKKLEFDLTNNTIPILTTKKMALKTCIKELLWFISGNTSNHILNQQNVHIWDGNSSREFLDKLGLNQREEGDLGPIYGFQWRHSGAKYIDYKTDYEGKGIDQLQNSIDLLKKDPHSRRNIVSAWNPTDLPLMALPPCHVLFQWYVQDNNLSLQMYQRSGDSFLGVPFNIFSYSLLVHMVAHITNLKPYKFIHILGDTHAYEQHLSAIKTQICRTPVKFPKLKILRQVNNINDFKLEDFEIIDYQHMEAIKAPMIA